MMYLGTLGQMVGLKCPTVQQVGSADRYSFMTTLGGSVKAQAGPVGRRTWDIRLGQLSTPADVGTLMDFATGVWGSGPFWFVSADAPVVNLLPPETSTCQDHSLELGGGAELLGTPPMDLGSDGVAARSVWKTDTGSVAFGAPVPVIPGRPVTGSAWVVGAGVLQLVFVDTAGQPVSTATSRQSAWVEPQRLSVTAHAPRNAAAVRLLAIGGINQAARPVITWTAQPYEWGDGQGCPKAVVRTVSRDVIKTWDNPRTGRWSDVSFVVQEVG